MLRILDKVLSRPITFVCRPTGISLTGAYTVQDLCCSDGRPCAKMQTKNFKRLINKCSTTPRVRGRSFFSVSEYRFYLMLSVFLWRRISEVTERLVHAYRKMVSLQLSSEQSGTVHNTCVSLFYGNSHTKKQLDPFMYLATATHVTHS